jgi:hypothetical protein
MQYHQDTDAARMNLTRARPKFDELKAGLIATCQEGDHWHCDEEFLNICRLSQEHLEKHIRKWWGNKNSWLDLLATEIAKALGLIVGLDAVMENSWLDAVDAWIDGTYERATTGMTCPPARHMLLSKAQQIVERIVPCRTDRSRWRVKAPVAMPLRVTCAQCEKAFSQSLGRCPSCFPAGTTQETSDKMSEAEVKQAAWRTLPSAPVHIDVSWSSASEMMWCHGGSGGVFLLRLATGAICIKAESCTPGMLLANQLAAAFNVSVASIRVASTNQEHMAIHSALRQAEAIFQDHTLQLRNLGGIQPMVVMQYVQGCPMMGVDAHNHLQEFDRRALVLHGLGRLMGYDLLINNFDRLPLAWNNEGNLGNVMLSSCSKGVVGIDQSTHAITHPDGLSKYIARIRAVCLEASGGQGQAFQNVKQAIYNNTAIDLSASEIADLKEGCSEILHEIAAAVSSGKMDQVLDESQRSISADLADLGLCTEGQLKPCCDLAREVAHAIHSALYEGEDSVRTKTSSLVDQ